MSVPKSFARVLALVALIFGGLQIAAAFDADAHPHKRWRKHRDNYSNTYNSSREVEVQVTIHRLIALDMPSVRGNHDRFITDGREDDWEIDALVRARRLP